MVPIEYSHDRNTSVRRERDRSDTNRSRRVPRRVSVGHQLTEAIRMHLLGSGCNGSSSRSSIGSRGTCDIADVQRRAVLLQHLFSLYSTGPIENEPKYVGDALCSQTLWNWLNCLVASWPPTFTRIFLPPGWSSRNLVTSYTCQHKRTEVSTLSVRDLCKEVYPHTLPDTMIQQSLSDACFETSSLEMLRGILA